MTLWIAAAGYLALGISTLGGAMAALLELCVRGELNIQTVLEAGLCGCIAMGGVLFTYLGILEVRRTPR